MKRAAVFVDGASRGNPGPAAAGIVFQDGDGRVIKSLAVPLGLATNNVAEYCALILALQEALAMRLERFEVFTDSELLARQLAGKYKIKEPTLRLLSILARHLIEKTGGASITHVPREKNALADAEANRALDRAEFLL